MASVAEQSRPIDDGDAAAALLRPHFDGLEHEEMRAVHLDYRLHPLGLTAARGEERLVLFLPLRQIIADALRLDAAALLVAHNHPGGDPTPSRADREATRLLAEIARPLGLRLVDHLIFGDDRHASLRELGLL